MKNILIALFLLFYCCSIENNDNKKIEVGVKRYHNEKAVERNIVKLYNQVTKVSCTSNDSYAKIAERIEVSTITIMSGMIMESEELDAAILLFFLKTYLCYLNGNKKLANISCCYDKNTNLTLFVMHFYKISNFDPTVGLMTKDVYDFVIKNNSNLTPEISGVLEDIMSQHPPR